MTERTLFIHAGGSKTGSSAIQNFLEFNATKLESIGYAYENRLNIKDYNTVTAGNGLLLFHVIKSVTTSNNEIDSLVLSYFGNCNIGICSSEFFADFNACNWKTLYELSVRLGFKLKILFFVRDVISYFQSGYDQVIKRHGAAVSFDRWVEHAEWQHYSALREIINEIPKSNIYVLSYEATKVKLVKEFLTILGVDLAFDFDANATVKKIINRSLTAKERDVLISVNNIFGDQFSREISDLLLYAFPDINSDIILFNDITKALLLDKFSYSVDWINRNFFNDEPVISVLPEKLINTKYDIETVVKIEDTNNDVHRLAFDWALKKLETIRNEIELRLLNSFSNAAQSDSEISHSNLPPDFSSVSYLLLNPDIRRANVNPVNHYIKVGKSEKRIYRFPKKSDQLQVNTSQKKLFFMTIPGTIGPLVKQILANQFKSDQIVVDAQSYSEWQINSPSDQIKFVSGAINYIEFKEQTEWLDYKLITCIRNPLEQIISLISHYRRYADEGNNLAFEACSKDIQLLALKLAKLDLASPAALYDLYKNLSNQELVILDNPQIRHLTKKLGITGQKIGLTDLEFAFQNLKKIDVVGDAGDLQTFISAVSKEMDWSVHDTVTKANDDIENYGMDINNPAVVNALSLFIKYDIALYSQRAQFRCAINTPK